MIIFRNKSNEERLWISCYMDKLLHIIDERIAFQPIDNVMKSVYNDVYDYFSWIR
jgi:hypothetical protein